MKPIVVVRALLNSEDKFVHFSRVCRDLENMIVTGRTANVFVPDINKDLLNFSRLQLGRAKPVIVLKSFFKLYHNSRCIRIAAHPILGDAILNLSEDSFSAVDRDYAYCGLFFYNNRLNIVFGDDPRSLFVPLPKESNVEGTVLDHRPLSKLFGFSKRAQNKYVDSLNEMPPDPIRYFAALADEGFYSMREDFAVTYEYFMARTRTGETVERWANGFSIIHLIVGYNQISVLDSTHHVYEIQFEDKSVSVKLGEPLPTENFQGKYLMRFSINMAQKICKVYITGYDKPDEISNILKLIKEDEHAAS